MFVVQQVQETKPHQTGIPVKTLSKPIVILVGKLKYFTNLNEGHVGMISRILTIIPSEVAVTSL